MGKSVNQWPGGSRYSEWKSYWDVECGDWKTDDLSISDVAEKDIVAAIKEIERLLDICRWCHNALSVWNSRAAETKWPDVIAHQDDREGV